MLSEAQEAARRVHGNLSKEPNYTGLTAPDRFFVGYTGEIIIREWLDESGKYYVYRVVTNGKSQKSEFVVMSVSNKKRLLEVKTASQERYLRFMMPEDQNMDFHIAIAVRLAVPKSFAEIMGVIGRRNVMLLPVDVFHPHTTPTRWKLYSELEDAARLLDYIV